MPGHVLGRELPLDHHLRGNTGMVGADLPQRVAALHPAEADQGVHDGVVEPMPHVQAAGHIWRRNHDAVGVASARRREMALPFPDRVPVLFDGLRFVSLVHDVRE